jgi:hypothetical protein
MAECPVSTLSGRSAQRRNRSKLVQHGPRSTDTYFGADRRKADNPLYGKSLDLGIMRQNEERTRASIAARTGWMFMLAAKNISPFNEEMIVSSDAGLAHFNYFFSRCRLRRGRTPASGRSRIKMKKLKVATLAFAVFLSQPVRAANYEIINWQAIAIYGGNGYTNYFLATVTDNVYMRVYSCEVDAITVNYYQGTKLVNKQCSIIKNHNSALSSSPGLVTTVVGITPPNTLVNPFNFWQTRTPVPSNFVCSEDNP